MLRTAPCIWMLVAGTDASILKKIVKHMYRKILTFFVLPSRACADRVHPHLLLPSHARLPRDDRRRHHVLRLHQHPPPLRPAPGHPRLRQEGARVRAVRLARDLQVRILVYIFRNNAAAENSSLFDRVLSGILLPF